MNSQVTTVLKEREERRFEESFLKFSRTGLTLTFAEFLMFALDRNLVQNKNSIGMLLNFFDDAVEKTKGERALTKPQFYFLLTQLSLHIYHNDKNHLDKLMSDILSEKNTIARDQSIEISRQIIFDEINKRILSEISIRTLCEFEMEMKSIFTIYMQENLNKGYIMLKWKEIAILNKKMNFCSLIKLIRDAEIVPHIISIEIFAENLVKIVPPVNNKEYDFYQKQKLQEIYEKNILDQVDGDPQISFHELQLLFARISFEMGSKDDGVAPGQNKKFDMERYLKKFLGELMLFRTNAKIQTPLPNLNRKLIKNIDKFTTQLFKEDSDHSDGDSSGKEDDHVGKLDKIAALQNSLLFEQVALTFPIEQVIRMLDKELPPLPPLPQPEKQMQKWDPTKRVTIGLPKPESPKNKNEKPKQAKAKQAQRRKQGEPEPRKVVFDNKAYPKQSEQYVQDLSEKLQFEQKLISDVDRGSLSDIQVAPVLIPEILYPPNPPPSVQIFIEAAINAHNEANFIFAIQNYEDARKTWITHQGRDLTDGLELYFEFSKGCVYESAGRDDMALQCFLNARVFGAKLPTNNPDKAIVYCGLGLIFYNTEEYEWALRSFLKAREYREFSIGVETIDTATVFNNLGCCMFMIDRTKESNAYFKLAHAILETQLGQFHPRTLTAARNINKSNNVHYENQAEYPKLWVAYAQDPFQGGKKKKKKKGKK